MDAFTTALTSGLSATVAADLGGIAPVVALIVAAAVGYRVVRKFLG